MPNVRPDVLLGALLALGGLPNQDEDKKRNQNEIQNYNDRLDARLAQARLRKQQHLNISMETMMSEWITCSERLPEIPLVLIYAPAHTYLDPDGKPEWSVDELVTYGRCYCYPNGDVIWIVAGQTDTRPVTHWMPLPEPPKEVV